MSGDYSTSLFDVVNIATEEGFDADLTTGSECRNSRVRRLYRVTLMLHSTGAL